MSDTDKTKPMHLRALLRPAWTQEYHDHRDGRGCDLPAKPTADNLEVYVPPGGVTGRCGWVVSRAFWASGLSRCCCRTCVQWRGWGVGEHRDRREGRAYARDGWRDEH